jgi:hypothetical protein
MEKKQTAVEWFYQRILAKDIESVFEQAKEMEKQQIIDANMAGQKFIGAVPGHYKNDAEQYYNETFKKD